MLAVIPFSVATLADTRARCCGHVSLEDRGSPPIRFRTVLEAVQR